MTDDASGNSVPVATTVKSVASGVAECEDIVLRASDQRRLLFRAKLMDGQSDGGVRGQLVYQRKKKDDDWDDCDNVKLTTIKAGEAVSIDLKTAEVAALRQWLNDLQFLKDQFGLPSETKFIGIRENPLAGLWGGDPVSVLVPQGAGAEHVAAAVTELLKHGDLAGVAAALKDTSVEELLALRQKLGLSALEKLIGEWDQDPHKDDEEHWQDLLTRHSFALEQVFLTPTVVIDGKAYVGGKSVANSGGNVADFLLATATTGRAMLVEIKKPTTPLIAGNSPYRNHAWNIHSEVTGSTVQVLTYRDSLQEEMASLDQEGAMLRRSPPRCAVIVGHTDSLDSADKQRSFELYRDRRDVQVITFDELRLRLEAIRTAFTTAEPA